MKKVNNLPENWVVYNNTPLTLNETVFKYLREHYKVYINGIVGYYGVFIDDVFFTDNELNKNLTCCDRLSLAQFNTLVNELPTNWKIRITLSNFKLVAKYLSIPSGTVRQHCNNKVVYVTSDRLILIKGSPSLIRYKEITDIDDIVEALGVSKSNKSKLPEAWAVLNDGSKRFKKIFGEFANRYYPTLDFKADAVKFYYGLNRDKSPILSPRLPEGVVNINIDDLAVYMWCVGQEKATEIGNQIHTDICNQSRPDIVSIANNVLEANNNFIRSVAGSLSTNSNIQSAFSNELLQQRIDELTLPDKWIVLCTVENKNVFRNTVIPYINKFHDIAFTGWVNCYYGMVYGKAITLRKDRIPDIGIILKTIPEIITLDRFIKATAMEVEYEEPINETPVVEDLTNFKQTNNTMEKQIISRANLKKIHDIACVDWKAKLAGYASINPFSNTVELTNAQVEEMYAAANANQHKVLDTYLKSPIKNAFINKFNYDQLADISKTLFGDANTLQIGVSCAIHNNLPDLAGRSFFILEKDVHVHKVGNGHIISILNK